MFLSKPVNKQRDPKMAIVALKKQTGFNQDFEFRCFGGKYQVLFFNQVSNRTNSK